MRAPTQIPNPVDAATREPVADEPIVQQLREAIDRRLLELDEEMAGDPEFPPPTPAAKRVLRAEVDELARQWLRSSGAQLPLPFVTLTAKGAFRCEWDTAARHIAWFFLPDGSTQLRVLKIEGLRPRTGPLIEAPSIERVAEALAEAGV